MRRLSQRESVLLGYAPQKPFPVADYTSEAPHGDIDVDFSDVFGGPPRRSSIHEIRFSLAESSDYNDLTSAGSDKPVFGEEGVNRRRRQSDNFFDDIFGGDEPLSSSPTPRRNFRDPFSSSPGSTVMSPTRPLPRKAEHFGTSLPAPSSLPAKLSMRMELPTFGSSTHGSSNRSKDGCPNGLGNYSYSPLSRSSSQMDLDQEDKAERQDNPGEDSNGSQILNNSSQFHFSIYKWAGSGVPLSMTFRGGNTSRLKPKDWHERSMRSEGCTHGESSVKGSPSQVSADDASSVFNNGSWKSFRMDIEKGQDVLSKKSLDDREQCEISGKNFPTSKSEVSSSSHTVKNNFHKGGSKSVLKAASDSLLKADIHDRPGKEIPNGMEEVQKPPGKSLSFLFYDNTGNKGNEEIAEKDSKGNESKNKNKSFVTVDDDKDFKENMNGSNVGNEEIGSTWTQAQPWNSGNHRQSKGKGKVKDFVKMFNQECSAKPKLEKVSLSKSSSWKERRTSRTENESITSTTETDKSRNVSNMGNMKSSPDISFKGDKLPQRTARQHSAGKDTNRLHTDVSKQRSSAAASDGLNARARDVDGSFEESFMIKEISNDEKKVPHTNFDSEELLVIDSKIRQWSHGKEGNIRSLLSTLQYVLWPDSGWKPVPLVDIIEGNAVKKSYQRALLCLHPDKLQQKGATLQQKYTAEKVFDILQDAWTHFSSLGLM